MLPLDSEGQAMTSEAKVWVIDKSTVIQPFQTTLISFPFRSSAPPHMLEISSSVGDV
jgi:hypothetical protein